MQTPTLILFISAFQLLHHAHLIRILFHSMFNVGRSMFIAMHRTTRNLDSAAG